MPATWLDWRSIVDKAPPPPVLTLTPLNPAFQSDPYPILNQIRQDHPVYRDEMAGLYFISRHEDVRNILTDLTMLRHPANAEADAVLTRRMVDGPTAPDRPSRPHSILHLDDPDHARVRNPLAQALYRRAARFKPQVEAIVTAALDRVEGQASFDLMSQFALPIPIDVIAAILGVDHDRLGDFRRWSEGIIHVLNPLITPEQTQEMILCGDALREYMNAMMVERRAHPQDDLVTDMVTLQAQGAELSDDEINTNLSALLVAGNLTTTDLIGNAVRLLLTHPDELAKLIADPSLIGALVEETLRFEPPVDVTARIASRPMEVQGCPIRDRGSMMLSLRAANRDPAVFDDPDIFNITRKRAPHVAFGGGAHICIGSPLARLEASVAMDMLFKRFPKLRLKAPDEAPQWRTLPFFRGLERLEVVG